MKRYSQNPDFQQKMKEAGQGVTYIGTAEYESQWDEMEKAVTPILKEAKAQ